MTAKSFTARLSLTLLFAAACGVNRPPLPVVYPPADARSGGTTTVSDSSGDAYHYAASNLVGARLDDFNFGHSIFTVNWVTAPASTSDIDGVGPRFNQRSCSACHAHDGRAPPFDTAGNQLGLLFRLSVDGTDAHGGPAGDPVYGTQLRTHATLGIPADGVAHVRFVEQPGQYADGTSYSLQVPTYSIDGWGYGPAQAGYRLSPRMGPATIGLGLLEAIPEADILAIADAGTATVHGAPNFVWDEASQSMKLGRFGWKANQPSVKQQTAGAFSGDMGITSSLFPAESCSTVQTACAAATTGGSPEVSDRQLDAIAFYMSTLAVPARRQTTDQTALKGEALFTDMGCASCHVATFVTSDSFEIAELAKQTIHPYTDLLLHDLGEGLSDGRPDYSASATQWRTPPLWGLGLLQTVNGHNRLLHDGRARGIEEAILWHGGEAQTARDHFHEADAADREAVLTFLQSL